MCLVYYSSPQALMFFVGTVGDRRKGGGAEGAERPGEAKREQNKGEEGEEGRAKTKKGKGR